MNVLLTFVLLFTLVMVGLRRLKLMNAVYALQSLSISAVSIYLGLTTNIYYYYVLALMTIIVKVIIIPMIVNRSIEKTKIKIERETIVNSFWSYVISSLLVIITLSLLKNFTQEMIKIGVVSILIGAYILSTRKQTLNHMIGFLVLENGIMLMELSTVHLDVVVEIGILLEGLLLVLLMDVIIYHTSKIVKE